MEILIRPILPNPRDYPANIIPLIDSATYRALTGAVKIRTRNALLDRVRGWSKPPGMGSQYRRPSKDIFQLDVFPTGGDKLVKKWLWVSRGTERHPISAVKAPVLRYQKGYTAHTGPGNKYGIVGGGSYAGPWVTAVEVEHPGIKARKFEEHVVEEIRKDIVRDIQKAIDLAVR